MRKKLFLFVALVVLISLLGFLSVKESFNLALGGDDWGQHYLNWIVFDVRKELSYFNPFTYLCTYCPHHFFLSIISRPFGYEPFYYFFASFLTRVTAALSLYFFIKHITGRILPAVLASGFFVASYLGIEATDWVFNYNHILGVGIVAIFLIWYFKTKESFGPKHLLTAALLFAAATIVSPPRMHGLWPLLVVAEVSWWLIEGRKFNLKRSSVTLLIMFFTNYMLLYGFSHLYSFFKYYFHFEIGPSHLANGYGSNGWNEERVSRGIESMFTWLSQGRSDFIIDPIATLGNFIIPDRLLYMFDKSPFTFLSYILPLSIFFLVSSIFVLYCAGIKRKFAIFYILNLALWIFFIYFLYKVNIHTFSYPRTAFALIGGFTIIISIWLFFLLKKNKPLLAHTLLLSIGWMNTFTIFPWVIEPVGLILSWGRYAIQQSAGVAIWMALIFFICIDALRKKRMFILLGFIYLLVFLFIFMHIKFSNDYLEYVASYRSKKLDARYWDFIRNKVHSLEEDGSTLFLLLTDQESAQIAEGIRFGFYARAGIYYRTKRWENGPVMEVNNYESALGDAYDGRNLVRHGHEHKAVPLSRIYAFALQKKEIYDITDQVRDKLREDLEALNKGTLTLPL